MSDFPCRSTARCGTRRTSLQPRDAAKSLERARQLNAEGNAPDSVVLEREARLAIARSNHADRQAGLEKCRTVLFPGLDQIMAIGR
ncbi:MAG: hypothetical protein GVY33_10490 [Alphaproteobacteria bacterium]|nr:hypothetical protein [Alphaproteobacteria bacterium]